MKVKRYHQPREVRATRVILYREMDRKQEAVPRWYFGSRVMYKLVQGQRGSFRGLQNIGGGSPLSFCSRLVHVDRQSTCTLPQGGAVSLSLPNHKRR
jgi:hypothetical protein